MKTLSKKEQLIYDNAGGGERGESAVKKYREYINGELISEVKE